MGDLVQRAKDGDESAWTELHTLHAPKIRHVCARMSSGDYDLADDLTQETFLQAWRKIHLFRGESAFSTWLYRIAFNVVLQYIRRDRKRAWMMPMDAPYEGVPARREIDNDLRIDIARAINALPAGYRMETLLHAVEGYEHQEIADMRGLTIGSSKSAWHKAKYKLQAALA